MAKRLDVLVTELAPDGHAVARVAGRAKLVVIEAGAVPGDRLEVEVEREARDVDLARVVRVLAPGPARVRPRCPIVARCGGCPWQAIAYPAQLEAKRSRLEEELRAAPALRHVPVSPVVPVTGLPDDPYGYRTKLQMAVGGRPGALEVGFFRPHGYGHGREVVAAPGCVVQHPEGNRIIAEARAILDAARVPPYDERRREGVLRYLLLRIDGSGARAALTLVAATERFRGKREVGAALAAIRGVTGVYLNVQTARSHVVLGPRTERLAGRERLLVEVAGERFLLSPTSFFQTSAAGAAALVERVRARLPGPYRTLVDLYCGAGLFARTLADRAAHVVGIEESRAAIEDALAGLRLGPLTPTLSPPRAPSRAAAGSAGHGPPGGGPGASQGERGRIEFRAMPAERYVREAGPVDAVVVDPPRAGLEPAVLEGIAASLRPRALVYVSCSPPALVRDLARLAALGYRTSAVDSVDMFPHTPHLECVASLSPGRP